ncbi:hypothetical protein SAMN05192583_1169 [Sphingomonas gellani]|uniref:Uncharacterized protein n=1 Tax=Sphingomonas gellani TaxID=1166340 RepID=A0A1H8B230_9SPHN|nr:hypothetical protein [Sphingomonas gellani]SEM76990.1 hypothetical protein SAMN05192583_1169 [Sphingomonas gellani]
MIRVRGLCLLLPVVLLLLLPRAAHAAPITVTKTAQLVSDPTGNTYPKAIPGAVFDYTITLANPTLNAAASGIVLEDAIPPRTELRVSDIALLTPGPVAFNGGLLGTSGLGYTFTSFDSRGDSIEFSSDNGKSWTYRPQPDADGYDNRVTNIQVKLTGSCVAGASASLRFRVRLR